MGRTQVPNSAPSRVHSAGATRAKGAPTKPERQHRQQQHATSPKSQASGQVYRPTPVKEHPDDAFVTGAWLFDQSRVPQWMQAQLPTALSQMRSTAAVPKPVQQQKKHASSPSKVIRPAPVHEHPDTAFVSGAWLFDTARAPLWMQRQVPAVATALVVRSRRLAKALPVSRAQHRPRSTKHYAAALPSLQAFGATPHAVIPCGSVRARHAHPDDAFYSGAWMFDAKCAPSWLAQELKTASKLLQQVVHVQKQKTNHMQFAGVKLTSGRKLGV